jgi:predicted enzyme related to lactoylglutathione lyase
MSGRVVHFEIPYDDAERAATFYRETFGWNTMAVPGMDYTMVSTGPVAPEGMPTEPGYIGGGLTPRGSVVSSPVVTVEVDDIDAAVGAVEQGGGSLVHGREPVGAMGWTAYVRDSEGNLIGLWQTAPQG